MTQRLTLFFQEVLLPEVSAPQRIVIFVDEIGHDPEPAVHGRFLCRDSLPLQRARQQCGVARLSFVLIGVATPGDLIRDAPAHALQYRPARRTYRLHPGRSPPFAAELQFPHKEARQVLQWVMEWTSGHPYLTQRLCLALIDQHRPQWTAAEVNEVVERTFFGAMSKQDNNLQFVRDMLTKRAPGGDTESVLTTYKEILTHPVPDEEQSLSKSHLKLSGIVRREGGKLHLRNRIYQTVFDKTWVNQHLPVNWTKLLKRAAYFAAVTLLILNVPVSLYAWNQSRKATTRANDLAKVIEELRSARQEAIKQKELADEARLKAQEQRDIATDQRARAEALQKEAEHSSEIATQQRRLAEQSGALAKEQGQIAYSRELASSSISQLQIDPELSLALAQKSIQVKYTTQGEDALRQSLVANQLRTELLGHTDSVSNAAYSPDGKFIVTTSRDKTARIWDVATGKELRVLQGHTAEVMGVAYSPDGKFIVTASRDKTARIYPDELFMPYEQLQALARTRPIRALTEIEKEKYLHEPQRSTK
ncbi:MAG: hypothetical protein U0Y68_07355 [Blastocatellia bacterium]